MSQDLPDTPLTEYSIPKLGFQYVVDRASFNSATTILAGTDSLAVDAERASGYRYGNAAYLLQFGKEAVQNYLFDPVALSAQLPNWQITLEGLVNQAEWILHAATQDLPCLAELGLKPAKLFDTEVAARLAGIERFGLASLCEQLLGVRIAKEHSSADWSTRPLKNEMLVYAAIDVELLFPIKNALTALLEEKGRTEWARQEFENLLEFQPRARPDNDWRRMAGSGRLRSPAQQAIAASLWSSRDKVARSEDTAPGRLIPDAAIVAIAAAPPNSKQELARRKDFVGRRSRTDLDLWWQAIENASQIELATEEGEEIPPHRSWERKYPEAWARFQSVRAAIVKLASELGIPPENLISPSIVRALCWRPAEIQIQLTELGARAWQRELTSELISSALADLG